MNKKTAVIYQSHYGATKRYAEWIAEELGAELTERKDARSSLLSKYGLVIYGGGLYAGGILGADLIAKNPCESLVLFTVGLTDPAVTDYSPILNRSFPQGLPRGAKVFHLRGGIDYGKLGLLHKGAMVMMKKMTIGKKTKAELPTEERVFADTYGGKVDFTDKASIYPLTEYVRGLGERTL
ncbi:MAG: flavodoxin domain-containing protein [Oscillospiraceae bacterium]|jgi:hypothetical protein|nr:flavodoxin domain-containing protein [Oscillospiraceae bacterium]